MIDNLFYFIGEYFFKKYNYINFKEIFENYKNYENIFENNFNISEKIKFEEPCEGYIFSMRGPTYELLEKIDTVAYCTILKCDGEAHIENEFVNYTLCENDEFVLNMKNLHVLSITGVGHVVMICAFYKQPYICHSLPPSLDRFLRPSAS